MEKRVPFYTTSFSQKPIQRILLSNPIVRSGGIFVHDQEKFGIVVGDGIQFS